MFMQPMIKKAQAKYSLVRYTLALWDPFGVQTWLLGLVEGHLGSSRARLRSLRSSGRGAGLQGTEDHIVTWLFLSLGFGKSACEHKYLWFTGGYLRFLVFLLISWFSSGQTLETFVCLAGLSRREEVSGVGQDSNVRCLPVGRGSRCRVWDV